MVAQLCKQPEVQSKGTTKDLLKLTNNSCRKPATFPEVLSLTRMGS